MGFLRVVPAAADELRKLTERSTSPQVREIVTNGLARVGASIERTANMTFESTDLAKNPVWATLLNGQAYYAKLFEIGAINLRVAFKYADKLSKVKSPEEFADVVANQIREQFESLSEEVEELSVTIQGVSSKGDMEMESGLGD